MCTLQGAKTANENLESFKNNNSSETGKKDLINSGSKTTLEKSIITRWGSSEEVIEAVKFYNN